MVTSEEEILRIRQENTRLQKLLEDKEAYIQKILEDQDAKQKEIEKLRYFIQRTEKDRELIEQELEKSEAKRKTCKLSLAKYLRDLQEIHNREMKAKVAKKSVSIGQMIHKRIGENFKQVWEDGDEVLKLKEQLSEIIKERESLEKIKRSKKCRNIIEKASTSGLEDHKAEVDNLFNVDNTLELTQGLFKIEENEQKEFLTFKINMKQKEEARIRELLENMKKEKTLLSNEMKRQNEELNSTLCGKKAEEKFKILDNQYLVLSLLGKGGYSEVYKAYDLEN